MEDLVRQLDDIVGYGITHDIFEAEEATAILLFTGKNAEAINHARPHSISSRTTAGIFPSSTDRLSHGPTPGRGFARELNYQDLTLAVVTAFSREMERLQNVAGTAVKTIRDKVLAHCDRIEEEALPRATSPAMRAMPAWAWPTVQCIFLAASQGGERRRKTRRRWS